MYPSILPTTFGGMKGFILENENIRGSEHADCGSRTLNATKLIQTVPHTDYAKRELPRGTVQQEFSSCATREGIL
jgi:hypothetical protein